MDNTKPKFRNETFINIFNKRSVIDLKRSELSDGIATLKELAQYIILDYKFNRNTQSSYELLQKFDFIIKEFTQELPDPKFEEERNKFLQIIAEVSSNVTLRRIRNGDNDQKIYLYTQAYCNLPRFVKGFKINNLNSNQTEVRGMSPKSKNEEENKTIEGVKIVPQKNDKELFLALVEKMKEHFSDHKIEDAYESKENLLTWERETGPQDPNKKLFASQINDNSKAIQQIDIWYKEVQEALQIMNDEEGYETDSGPKAYTLRYKNSSDGTAILKMEGVLRIPIFNILALMYETDNFNQWVPFCSEAQRIKNLHKAAYAYWLKYSLPPPLTARDCHCYGFGVNRLDRNGSVLLMSKSIDFNDDFLNHYGVVSKETKCVKMDIQIIVECVPISREEMMARLIIKADPKIKNVPKFILTFINRKIGQYMFEIMLKKAKDLKGTAWEKGINDNPEFYGWLNTNVDKFIQEHELA